MAFSFWHYNKNLCLGRHEKVLFLIPFHISPPIFPNQPKFLKPPSGFQHIYGAFRLDSTILILTYGFA